MLSRFCEKADQNNGAVGFVRECLVAVVGGLGVHDLRVVLDGSHSEFV